MHGFFIDAVINSIIAIIMYIIFVIFVLCAVPIFTRWVKPFWIRSLLRFVLIVFLVALPFLYEEYKAVFAEKRLEYKERKLAERKQHLIQACQTEAKLTINKKIPTNTGIFVTYHEKRKHRLPNNEEYYKACMSSRYNRKMIEEPESYCGDKYVYPISWARNWKAGGYVKKHLKPAYVEGIKSTWKVRFDKHRKQWTTQHSEQIAKLTTDDGYPITESYYLYRTGTIRWWKTSEQKAIFEQWTVNNPSKKQNDDWLAIPVLDLVAPYRFVAEDISTWEDRDKGIRRGRLALENRKTNEVMSEYISFDTVPWDSKYAHNPFSISHLTCLDLKTKNKKGTKKITVFDDFLRQVANDKQ